MTRSRLGQRVGEESLKFRLCGQNLISLIRKKKVTKYRLAKDLGVTYRTVQYWTDKKNPKKPSDENLKALAGYFGITFSKDDELRLLRSEYIAIGERLRKLEKSK